MECQEFYAKALEIYESLNNEEGQITVLLNVAGTFTK